MELSESSKKKLEGVKVALRKIVEIAAELAGDNKAFDFDIVQGKRTQEYQNQLYAQGRTRPGKIVTWTKNSKHLGGDAVDFAALDERGRISWDEKKYPVIASIFQRASEELKTPITWGGEWKNKDWGHIQLAPGKAPSKPAVAEARPVPPYEVLKKGSKGDKVKELQRMLTALGYDVGPIDGDFGPRTENAVKKFQADHQLVQDGKVGPLTWTKLQETSVPKPPASVEAAPRIPVADLKTGKDYDKIVRHYEGELLNSYEIGGHWHIGVGHSASSRIAPVPYEGMQISVDEMNHIFKKDTEIHEEAVKKELKVPLTQRQFDALVSLHFNRERTFRGKDDGPGKGLMSAVNNEDWNRAEMEFEELVNAPAADGKFYRGLANRRRTERDLFAGRAYETY